MRDASLQTIHLKEYTPPAYLISDIALEVDIVPGCATVRSTLKVARNASRGGARQVFPAKAPRTGR